MNTQIETPEIQVEQKAVIDWVRKWRKEHFNATTMIELLVSKENTSIKVDKNELEEMRKIYNKFNSSWKGQLLLAIMIDNYRFKNDIRDGQIVSNETYVGYAFNVDYKIRRFELYSLNDKQYSSNGEREIGFVKEFSIDEFKQIKTIKN